MRISDWSSDVCSSDLWCPVHLRVDQPVGRLRAEQQMVDPEPGVARPAACLIIPEAVEPVVIGVDEPQRVGPSLKHQPPPCGSALRLDKRSEEHTSELQSLMRISYAVFCLKKKKTNYITI